MDHIIAYKQETVHTIKNCAFNVSVHHVRIHLLLQLLPLSALAFEPWSQAVIKTTNNRANTLKMTLFIPYYKEHTGTCTYYPDTDAPPSK